MSIYAVPVTLVVGQIHSEVNYPLELRLPADFMSAALIEELAGRRCASSGGDCSAVYDLTGVILHHGPQVARGHYTTYCRDMSSPEEVSGHNFENLQFLTKLCFAKWIHFDDSALRSAASAEVLGCKSTAYILLYTFRSIPV